MSILIVVILMAIGGIVGLVSKKVKTNSMKKEEEEQEVFIVLSRNCMERKLTYTSFQGKTPRTDYNDKSPYYGKKYQFFVDDVGNYWRSYDNCKTFIVRVKTLCFWSAEISPPICFVSSFAIE